MTYGFIGTGTITEAIIVGMMHSRLATADVVVSPRSDAVARSLAQRFPNVTVAESNQAVVDAADIVILAVRPQVAEEVLTALAIPRHKKLISLIAATKHARLAQWTGHEADAIVRAIPLPFVAAGEGVTPILPADATAQDLFDAMGKAVVCATQDEFDLFAVSTALMGTYFGMLERVAGWLAAKGLTRDQARDALVPMFGSLARMAAAAPQLSFQQLREGHSTRGGLNEQVFADFEAKGGSEALLAALDRVLTRVRQ